MLTSSSSPSVSEQQIVEGLKAGGLERRRHENALFAQFVYLVKQHEKKYSLSEEEALGAYSDTILTVITNVVGGSFEGRASLKSYTTQIFMNKCVDVIRKKTTNKNVVNRPADIDSLANVLPDKARNVVQALIDKNERSSLLKKLDELTGKCKQILLLYEDGYSDQEIAQQMDYKSADVVKTSRMRCLEKLKEQIFSTGKNYE
jgi:RNA polymerase sigma-70 factor (ECF subfamily)